MRDDVLKYFTEEELNKVYYSVWYRGSDWGQWYGAEQLDFVKECATEFNARYVVVATKREILNNGPFRYVTNWEKEL